MHRAFCLGVAKDVLQKFNDLRERQFFDPRNNTLQSACNGAEPVGSFLTFSFFVLSYAVFHPFLLMLQLSQLAFIAGKFLLELVTLRVFLIHFISPFRVC